MKIKINASVIFGTLKYWMMNGKTITSIIIGLILALMQQSGMTVSEANLEMVVEFLKTFSLFLGPLFVGVIDKARKTIQLVADKE